MTQPLPSTSDLTIAPRREPGVGLRWPVRAGCATACSVAAAGLLLATLVVLVGWATTVRDGSGASDLLRTAGQLWLLAHGVSLELADGRIGLTPLGLAALPVVLLVRSSGQAARRCRVGSPRAALALALTVAVPYALLAALVSMLSVSGAVRPLTGQALFAGFAVGLVGAFAGSLRPGRVWRAAWLALPGRLRRLIPAVAAATAVLLAGGALVVGGSLALHLGLAADLAGTGKPGIGGGVALLLLGLTLVPNAVVWGASWLAGPGFAAGVGTTVGPFAHELGPVPSFPLLAALPAGGVPGALALLSLLLPLAAGALAGRLVQGQLGGSASLRRTAVEAASAGPALGLVWLPLLWLAGGPVGGARLSVLGPSPRHVAFALTAEVAVGAVAAALLLRRRSGSGGGGGVAPVSP